MNLTEDAAGWLVRLEHDPTPQCRAEFAAWLRHSPTHMEEFLSVTAAYKELDGLEALGDFDLKAAPLPNIVTLEKSRPPVDLRWMNAQSARPERTRWKIAGLAAALLAAIFGVDYALPGLSSPDYSTATGEQRSIKLDDGSVIQLNTRSRVIVKFSKQARDVHLLEGEALFSVEQDRNRPFRVFTDTAVVRAIGTQFNVYRRREVTTVSVVQGAVQVSGERQTAPDNNIFTAGEAVRVDREGRVVKQARTEVTQAIVWRQRKLDFRGTPLNEVAEQFNRYNRIRIRVEDGKAAGKQLNGVFNADEPQALLSFLAQDPGLRFEREGKDVTIRAR